MLNMMIMIAILAGVQVPVATPAAAATPGPGAAAQQRVDTTFAVRSGARLELESLAGSVSIRTWDREAMNVRATYPAGVRVRIRQRAGGADIETEFTRGGAGRNVQYEITVPRSFSADIEGMNLRVTVEGVQGPVSIENIEGAIVVRNVTGNVDIESVSGSILAENIRGNVDAVTINQNIRLNRITGRLSAETANGAIVMSAIESTSVEASTVNGYVQFDGALRDGGRYYLGTHNGQITMTIAEQTNASLNLVTVNGKVEASFPVPLTRLRNSSMSLTLGTGAARVELESFNGSIRLIRPGGR